MWPSQVGRNSSGCRTSVKMGIGSKNQFLYLFMRLFLIFIHAMSASGVCGTIAQNLYVSIDRGLG